MITEGIWKQNKIDKTCWIQLNSVQYVCSTQPSVKVVARVIVGSVDLAGSSSAIRRHVLKANLYFRVKYKSGTQAERVE